MATQSLKILSGRPSAEYHEGLIRRKYTDRNIELILGGNFQRALCQIWTA